MPSIKKKWIKASHDDQVAADLPGLDAEDVGDEDRELGDAGVPEAMPVVKPSPSSAPTTGMLKNHTDEILLEKRKRFVPSTELKLNEWIDINLEQRTEETMSLPRLYDYFVEFCQGESDKIIVDVGTFQQGIRKRFGKSFGLKEGSIYKSLIKERKLNVEKKKPVGGISLKDALYEALNFYNNPWGGVQFRMIKQYIGSKYPGLRIENRLKGLKRALEVQVDYGKLDLVRGVGMAGFYKIPGGEEPPPAPKKVKKEEAEAATNGEVNGEEAKGDEKGENGVSEVDEKGEEKKEGETDETSPKKPKKPTTYKKVKLSNIAHGNPRQIEDTFPLAITYQSAPKVAGAVKIRRYIQEKYRNDVTDSRWKSAIEKGLNKGWWEPATDTNVNPLTGRLHLLMDDFDPSSDQLEDQICGALIACHEPKSCTANKIKQYIISYHEDFGVENRPDKFKKALIRGVQKGIVVQLSGLGACGTYALTQQFVPSPTVLAGEDDSDSEEEESDEDDLPVYISKGTKSRGVPKTKVYVTSPSRQNAYSGRAKPSAKRGRGRKARVKSYNEDEEEEEEEVVPKKKARASSKNSKKSPVKKTKGKAKKARSPSPLTDEEVEEQKPVRGRKTPAKSPAKNKKSRGRQRSLSPLTDEEIEEAPPAKSKSRATPSKANAKSIKAKMVKGKGLKMNISTQGSASKKGRGAASKQSYVEDSDVDDGFEEEDSEPEYTPKKSSSRGAASKSSAKKRGRSRDDSDDDVEPEYTPKKSKSRGGAEPASKASSKKKKRR